MILAFQETHLLLYKKKKDTRSKTAQKKHPECTLDDNVIDSQLLITGLL